MSIDSKAGVPEPHNQEMIVSNPNRLLDIFRKYLPEGTRCQRTPFVLSKDSLNVELGWVQSGEKREVMVFGMSCLNDNDIRLDYCWGKSNQGSDFGNVVEGKDVINFSDRNRVRVSISEGEGGEVKAIVVTRYDENYEGIRFEYKSIDKKL